MATLLEQLGGREAVELVVAAFYERVLGDGALRPFFRQTSMARLQKHQTDFFVTALGGEPCYGGRKLEVAHAGMGITDAHFDAVAGHLVGALRQAGVTEPLIERVVSLVGPLRPLIVSQKAAEPQPIGHGQPVAQAQPAGGEIRRSWWQRLLGRRVQQSS